MDDLINKYEKNYQGAKYLHIDNYKNKTIIFFAGMIHRYPCISWFKDCIDYNFLFLMDTTDNTYVDSPLLFVVEKEVQLNNCVMIGFSMGGCGALLQGLSHNVCGIIAYDSTPVGKLSIDIFLRLLQNVTVRKTMIYLSSSSLQDYHMNLSLHNALIGKTCIIYENHEHKHHLSFVHEKESMINLIEFMFKRYTSLIKKEYNYRKDVLS
jgi:hypothetical protein